ncbi:sorting nexin-8 [Anabrus simplex]|uniref:sorting nexin-8 n=1 Tax=Anabrus simplex TaxID=316456 RepID=UPI0035A2C87B
MIMRPLLYAVAIVSSQFFLFLIMKLLLQDNTGIPPQGENELAEDYSRLQSSEPVELNIVGLILARGGSKGIKKKNLMKIGNITLVGRSLRAIHEFGRFSSVWVSTDSVEIAGEAKAHGALIHWRSKESATDTAPSILGVQDFLSHHTDINIIGLIQCTSPFLTATFLTEAYDLMLQGDYDSVFSATRKFDLRWEENAGSVPPLYREVYDICSPTSDSVDKEVFTKLLVKSELPSQTLSSIWELVVEPKQSSLSRSSLYKALALVAWAQQGKQPTAKLLENFSGEELPTPELGDLAELKHYTHQVKRTLNPTNLGLCYPDICQLDTIEVDLVPEKKGLFLKHVEYQVSSKRFSSLVRRRYNDFVALHELLLGRFPYRLIPKLPPKRIVGGDAHFIEERRKSLKRWLTLVARHPAFNSDPLLNFFLTYNGPDVQHKIREVFRRVPDEFTTSELAEKAKDLVPPDTHMEFANSRDQIRIILHGISRLKQIADLLALRAHGYAADMSELGAQLSSLAAEPHGSSNWATGGNKVWAEMKKGFHIISKEFNLLSSKALQQAVREEEEVCEKLNLLLDVLIAHRELCDRHEKGVLQDHAKALSKMLALKKRQMQGVIRGTDAESVEQLENKMMEQESVIANVELRNAFSLHCLHMETQLVHAHLEILASVLSTLVAVQIRGHSELAQVWELIQPTIVKCLPDKHQQANGDV